MPGHSDPGDLALRALWSTGSPAGYDSDAHLDSCPRCQSELDQLRAVVAAVRRVGPDDRPSPPPPEVWEAIVAELGLATAAHPVHEMAVRRTRHARRSTVAVASVAAAVGLVAGAVAGVWGVALMRDEGGDPAVVASARLEPLEGTVGGGAVTVHGATEGRVLTIDVDDLTPTTALREVWLLADDGRRLLSLGLLAGSRSHFNVPQALDLADFPVVDVSLERADGNPAHSGNSVLRGRLRG